MKTKTFLTILNTYKIYTDETKFTQMKHKNKTNITQYQDAHMFMTYLREIINQKPIKSG